MTIAGATSHADVAAQMIRQARAPFARGGLARTPRRAARGRRRGRTARTGPRSRSPGRTTAASGGGTTRAGFASGRRSPRSAASRRGGQREAEQLALGRLVAEQERRASARPRRPAPTTPSAPATCRIRSISAARVAAPRSRPTTIAIASQSTAAPEHERRGDAGGRAARCRGPLCRRCERVAEVPVQRAARRSPRTARRTAGRCPGRARSRGPGRRDAALARDALRRVGAGQLARSGRRGRRRRAR